MTLYARNPLRSGPIAAAACDGPVVLSDRPVRTLLATDRRPHLAAPAQVYPLLEDVVRLRLDRGHLAGLAVLLDDYGARTWARCPRARPGSSTCGRRQTGTAPRRPRAWRVRPRSTRRTGSCPSPARACRCRDGRLPGGTGPRWPPASTASRATACTIGLHFEVRVRLVGVGRIRLPPQLRGPDRPVAAGQDVVGLLRGPQHVDEVVQVGRRDVVGIALADDRGHRWC